MISVSSSAKLKAHVKQLGVSLNRAETQVVMSEAVNQFCSFMIFFKNGAIVVSKLALGSWVGPHTAANNSVYATSRLVAAVITKAVSQHCD